MNGRMIEGLEQHSSHLQMKPTPETEKNGHRRGHKVLNSTYKLPRRHCTLPSHLTTWVDSDNCSMHVVCSLSFVDESVITKFDFLLA